MKQNRDVAISETLKWEGGYTNHPQDPGGPTNWGITLADAKKYWKKGATAQDVKNMPKQVAIDIYASKYWRTKYYDCDKLASGVDLAVFDFGVNSGPLRAKQHLDKAVGGPSEDTINKICDSRMAFLKRLTIWPTFGKGWTNRVKGIRSKSLELAKKPETAVAEGSIFAGISAAFVAAVSFFQDYWMEISIGTAVTLAIALYLTKRIKEYKNAQKAK